MNPLIKKGSELNLQIDSLSYGGKGISRYEGIVIFTNNVLPGQTVKARIIKKKKNYLEAIPIEVIEESFIDPTDKMKKFVAVKVKYKKHLKKKITLENIKKNKKLGHLALIKQSRLSIMPIDMKSWKILNKMGNIQ